MKICFPPALTAGPCACRKPENKEASADSPAQILGSNAVEIILGNVPAFINFLMVMSRVRLITFARIAMPLDLLAEPKVAFAALDCYAEDLASRGLERDAFLKSVCDRDYKRAPPGAKAVCYVLDCIGVLVAYHVPTPGSRVRPYIMITHLYVQHGQRNRDHSYVMLHMLREYALCHVVAEVCLGQGLRENAETVDYWVQLGFHIDDVKSLPTRRVLMEEKIDLADFGLNLPQGRSFMRARLEMGTSSSWNAALRE